MTGTVTSFAQRDDVAWETVDHHFRVPLDHADPGGEQITVYGREVRLSDGRQRPWLVFLQGGPGSRSPRPTDLSGWLRRAVDDYRVLLLDQRGTGRSSVVNRQTLPLVGDPAAQARYVTHFRADSIVRDAEAVRTALAGPDTPWTVLGQSFGGFCATTYLSFAPRGLDRVLITGGLPGLDARAEDVFRLTVPKMLRRNEEYYARYPGDRDTWRQVAEFVADRADRPAGAGGPVRLPCGDRLTPGRLRYLGMGFGMTEGYAQVHHLAEDAWARPGVLSDQFLTGVEQATSMSTNPLFALLLEPCFDQGPAGGWAADRVLAEFAEFADGADVFRFTGEMIFSWMFEEYGALRPMAEAAEILARDTHWPVLYDAAALARNAVPVAAAIYDNDLYVPRELSTVTAARIAGATAWVTSEFEHDGLRRHGERIFETLQRAATGGLRHHAATPSP